MRLVVRFFLAGQWVDLEEQVISYNYRVDTTNCDGTSFVILLSNLFATASKLKENLDSKGSGPETHKIGEEVIFC